MTQARFAALCRAWHRKTRRPVPAVTVTVDDRFFDTPDDDNGQRAFAAAIPKHGA